ncbi:MAG: FAD-dependent oxidoreductase [Sedimentisphaerales bacterium]|nr:FAD-dependent oxidoreductase [Sedimentisphaerales bacterium]
MMKKFFWCTAVLVLSFLLIGQSGCTEPEQVNVGTVGRVRLAGPAAKDTICASARRIPVAYNVDVVVVGGTSGGVAAAVKAAEKGAKVFLAAQQPYLGADLCGTYRLWLEPGEVPKSRLAKAVFAESASAQLMRNSILFTYQTDIASAGVHKDTAAPSVLNDGKWGSASSQSVQYDGDVGITVDLGRARQFDKIHLMTYQRRNPGASDNFEVAEVSISLSDDKEQWREVATIKNERAGESLNEPWGPIELSAPVSAEARYIRLLIKKSEDAGRVLLGEIIIEGRQAAGEVSKASRTPPTPMHVKRTFDAALLDAGVEFLYGCYVTDVLVDGQGNVAGIVMANRSGRQAVKAKVVIDATHRASVARIAGAAFPPYPSGPRQFKYVTIGGQMQTGPEVEGVENSPGIWAGSGAARAAYEYRLTIPMEDGSFASFARAEQVARDKTWHSERLDASEVPFEVPPDPIRTKVSLGGRWPGARWVNPAVFRPVGFKRLYVLGGCAGVSRKAAEKLLRPVEYMDIGARIGAAAAAQAKLIGEVNTARVASRWVASTNLGDIREDLSGLRGRQGELGFVEAPGQGVPVLGEYDVVVIGGGTGGAPAGISAARQGAKTLVVEYLHGLGGVGTMGYISKYYYGYIKGFTAEVDQGVADISSHGENTSPAWNPELKKEWYRRELRKAGADIWFGAIGCGAFVEDGKVKGAVVATDDGRGVVLAKVVIDSTGNADIAASAGASCVYTDGSSVAVQGAGLPPRGMGAGYTNTDWTFVDDGDVIDVWRAFVTAKDKYQDAFDLGQLVDTRERRRIVGDFTMSPMDISLDRTYGDTIVISRSNFDTHGFTIHPLFMIRPPDRESMLVNVPYRCLLPEGLDGILVTGLGISAHRDAMPVIRMQADIQNQGYAAGFIAADTAKTGKSLREVDIKAVQRHLVEKGNLPETVLSEKDSFPLSLERVIGAVEDVIDDYNNLEVILAQPEEAMPLVKRAYGESTDEKAKLVYAHILGMHGDVVGAETLEKAVEAAQWDKGWHYTGMGQFGMSLSYLDSLIVALGRTKSENALEPILEKVQALDSESEFSHCRAVALALEAIGNPAAAKPLAESLQKPGIMGHAFTDIDKARKETPADASDTTTRNASLKELFLARALYRCGDYEGLGEKILKEYARDLRGHYARHAAAILKERQADPPKP